MQAKKPKEFVFHRREPDIPEELNTDFDVDSRDINVHEKRITEAHLGGKTFSSLRIQTSILDRVNFANCTFGSILLKDVRLVGCDLANLVTRGLTLVRVEFLNCRMTGFRGGEIDAQDVLISEGDQRYCQFRYSKFKAAEFDSCNFQEADLQGTDFSGSIFRKCNLQSAEMIKAKLVNADLRGSIVDDLKLEAPDVRGAIVDAAQALAFAPLLGLHIK